MEKVLKESKGNVKKSTEGKESKKNFFCREKNIIHKNEEKKVGLRRSIQGMRPSIGYPLPSYQPSPSHQPESYIFLPLIFYTHKKYVVEKKEKK